MRSARYIKLTIIAIATALLLGCGDDGGNATGDSQIGQPDGGASVEPSSSFKSLTQYDVAAGTFEVTTDTAAGVTKVELLADGKVVAEATAAPFSISWDTTATPDGVVKLSLKAHADAKNATSDEIPVVVLNNGEEVTFTEGSEQTVTIDPALDNHVKVHWTMPAGVKTLIGVVFWDNREFKMELAMGTGNCPHSGQQACSISGESSPLMTAYPEGVATGTLGETLWFVHAGATNEADLAGKTCKFTFKAFLLK